jgi:NAD(P)-dependent dehydrogenase (short-subunit alcohol dehydrogenase family)
MVDNIYEVIKREIVSSARSLAIELASFGIRVNCVPLGWVDTDICADVFLAKNFRKKVEKSFPSNRIPPPKDI